MSKRKPVQMTRYDLEHAQISAQMDW